MFVENMTPEALLTLADGELSRALRTYLRVKDSKNTAEGAFGMASAQAATQTATMALILADQKGATIPSLLRQRQVWMAARVT